MTLNHRPHVHRARRALAAFALVLLVGLLGASLASAEDTSPSPLVPFAPTTEELLAAPPSIERYVAAHTLPLSARSAAGLDKAGATMFALSLIHIWHVAGVHGQHDQRAGHQQRGGR